MTAVDFDDTLQGWRAVLRAFRRRVIDPGCEAQNPTPPVPPRPSPTK